MDAAVNSLASSRRSAADLAWDAALLGLADELGTQGKKELAVGSLAPVLQDWMYLDGE